MYTAKDLAYRAIEPLKLGYPAQKPQVPDCVFEARKARLVDALRQQAIDAVVIYADREHYANFKYYTGVDPRFEEALLVVHCDGRAFLALGNECLALVNTSAIRATGATPSSGLQTPARNARLVRDKECIRYGHGACAPLRYGAWA